MKRRKRTAFKRKLKGSRTQGNRARTVKRLAAEGLSGDVIAATLGINRDKLRRSHALDLQEGREKMAAQRLAKPTNKEKRERRLMDVIEASFESDWFSPLYGNDLFGGAMTPEEALDWCRKTGGGSWIGSLA